MVNGSIGVDPKMGMKVAGGKAGGRMRIGHGKVQSARGSQGFAASRGINQGMPAMGGALDARGQAQVDVHGQSQLQAQAAAQAQAQSVGGVAGNPAAGVQMGGGVTEAMAQEAQVNHQRQQQMRAHLARVHGNQKARPGQGGNGRGQGVVQPGLPTWGNGAGASVAANRQNSAAASQANRAARRQGMSVDQRIHMLDAAVKEAVDNTAKLEVYVEVELKRAKNERIQNTLAALRNNAGGVGGGLDGRGTKRQASLVDVDNFDSKEGVIKSKTVFECSGDSGLRLAKRPKNEAADVKSLRDAVEADCKAAIERNPLIMISIAEEFGQPVVTCMLKIPEIRLPKLVLRVQRGYPRKGGATYGFERPVMGWIGVLDEIRTRFKQALATAPAASVGVAAFLNAWAREADAVINGSRMSDSR